LNGLGEKKWLNNDDPLTCNVNPDSLKRGEVSYGVKYQYVINIHSRQMNSDVIVGSWQH